jgi:hypothetical protein
MKKQYQLLIIVALVVILLSSVAAVWRTAPLSGYTPAAYTVATSADTTVTVPASHNAVQWVISNDGTGQLYLSFDGTAVDTATDTYVKSGECLSNVNIPFRTLKMKTTGASSTVRVFISY